MLFRDEHPSAKELTRALGGTWNEHKRHGKTRCPAHDDTNPSLEITEGKNGKTLLFCQVCRDQDKVIDALRLKGLWPECRANGKANGGHADPKRIVAVYDYTDATGTLTFQVVRYAPKTFRQRHPNDTGGWEWKAPVDAAHRHLPYRLPEVIEAIALEKPVVIVEGEKDVETAAKLGITATCNAGGVGGWTAAHAAYLKDADVIVVPDNDDAGRRHAADVAASLVGVARRVRMLTLPDLQSKGDLSDWAMAGGTAEELLALAEKAPEIKEPPPREDRRVAHTEARQLVSKRLSKVPMRQVKWVWPGRIAAGMHTTTAGEAGVGKSTMLYGIAATITRGGLWPCGEGQAPKGSVIILSAEDAPEFTIKPRVLAAGGDDDKVTVVTATRDDDGKVSGFTLSRDLLALETLIDETGDVVLVIIDPISSYLGDRVDGHSNTDIRGVVEPLHEMAARKGVAVLTNTHFAKSGAANKSRASHRIIGSTAFLALPRVALSVVQDSEDEERRLVLHLKNNIAPAAKGLAFRLQQRLAGYIGEPPDVQEVYASCVEWESEHVTKTADQAIAEHEDKLRGGKKDRPSPARDNAEAFIRVLFKGRENEAIAVKELNEAARAAGVTSKPLREAKEKLCETVAAERNEHGIFVGFLLRLKKGAQP